MRVVFFGSPDFAVPSLRALLGEGFDVPAVVTQPDKPRGRSRSTLVPPPVKVAAQAEGVPVLQPERPTGASFLRQLAELRPDVGVVVAYGHILKLEVLTTPPRGMVNVHPSLLPALRGAAPIEWAILNGLDTTGVSIIQMDPAMDAGPVLLQLPMPIPPDGTGGELTARLAELGAQALVEALALLEQGAVTPVPQDATRATYAPKLTRDTARIDWTRPPEAVARTVRALDPRPGAWTELRGSGERGAVEVKVFGARTVNAAGHPGEVLETAGQVLVAAGSGAVAVDEVQPAGKSRMPAADWMRGRGVRPGDRFA
ncbi:MAG: methionyl-tRNA formyltransferase [Gemmatimonadales bacterium]